MHNYLPSLKQMQYLVALHEHGHFGRAADACNVTQSTLSAGIRELETLLGQTLVERTRRVVEGSAANAGRFHAPVLADPVEGPAYVERELAAAPAMERFDWLYRYDARVAPLES